MDNKAMFRLSYGLFILSAARGGKDNACVINTVTQVASTPNQISVSLNKTDFTHDMLKETGLFTASVLTEKAPFDLYRHFGYQSGRDVDKFADFADYDRAPNGTVYLNKYTNAFISGKVSQVLDLGSHSLFIAEVTDMEVLGDDPSVTYAYYFAHVKPQPQPRTAAPATGRTKTVWRCRICGYEYEGEELPADYICPICKHPASDFEKVVVPV